MLKKSKKAGFFDPPPKRHARHCDHTGCAEAGEFRAPKSRDNLNEYYWFCLDHVRHYNLSWDYFHGLAPDEVEEMRRNDTVWERPSWPFGNPRQYRGFRQSFNRKWSEFAQTFGIFDEEEPAFTQSQFRPKTGLEHNIMQAMQTLGLTPPLDYEVVKRQYKILVKKFHPDLNGGEKSAEERFKSINEAFQTLKKAFDMIQKNDSSKQSREKQDSA